VQAPVTVRLAEIGLLIQRDPPNLNPYVNSHPKCCVTDPR
jgi:hypothetical protein